MVYLTEAVEKPNVSTYSLGTALKQLREPEEKTTYKCFQTGALNAHMLHFYSFDLHIHTHTRSLLIRRCNICQSCWCDIKGPQ